MNRDQHKHPTTHPPCREGRRANAYLDAELPLREHAALFTHLAGCAACRAVLETGLVFRRMVRHERVAVPPKVDEHFLQRLSEEQARNAKVDRTADRNPLWQARRPISLGVALTAALALSFAGFFSSGPFTPEPTPAVLFAVEGFQERVEFRPGSFARPPISQPPHHRPRDPFTSTILTSP